MKKLRTVFRSAITGRFVKKWVNKKYPKTTFKQTLSKQAQKKRK